MDEVKGWLKPHGEGTARLGWALVNSSLAKRKKMVQKEKDVIDMWAREDLIR